ncbi:nuclear transport factor 2 family protein [Solitalea sp. MAHUQ-68]|uniref:Nuclear transport factor 2 family protein n=1 Tax=Solitalea agri TaxID=2953739 RepID=A0A9X2F3C4_9SPHI|nr:nuclear transport factor 2 family protein [Solitalea agri]MCO4293481.1 nuclear transport factor 2 family protein [Solitalea agri]
MILLFIPIVGFTQSKDVAVIKNLLNTQAKAWSAGNLEEFMDGYWKSDSLMFIGKNGPKYGWQTTLDNYKKSYPDKSAMGQLNFNIIKVEVLSPTSAFVIGRWELEREKDKPSGYYTLLLKKIKGKWKIVADHSS